MRTDLPGNSCKSLYYGTWARRKRSAARINFSQSFNGLGWIAGPLVGGMLIFSVNGNSNKFASIALPYILIGTLVLIVAFLFWRIKFPHVKEENLNNPDVSFIR